MERSIRRDGLAAPVIGLALRRAAFVLVAIWFAATLTFLLVHAAPGGPGVALMGENAAPGQAEEIRRALGLDRGLLANYLDWLRRLSSLDLGVSYRSRTPVLSLILERAPVTIAVIAPAIVLAALLGTLLGMGLADGRGGSRAASGLLSGLHAMPSYVVAQGLVLVLALGLGWFPVQGIVDPRSELEGFAFLRDVAWRLTLPVLSLAILQLSFVALVTRARLREELLRPYAVTARAKGLDDFAIKRRHCLINAAAPLVTLVGWRFGAVIGGSAIIETVFALPGLGRLMITSAVARDHPTVVGIVLISCVVIVCVNTVVDLMLRRIDPRIEGAFP